MKIYITVLSLFKITFDAPENKIVYAGTNERKAKSFLLKDYEEEYDSVYITLEIWENGRYKKTLANDSKNKWHEISNCYSQ